MIIKYAHRVLIGVNILHGFNPTWFWAFVSNIEPSELLFIHVTQVVRIFWTVATHPEIVPPSSSELQPKPAAFHASCIAWAKQSC